MEPSLGTPNNVPEERNDPSRPSDLSVLTSTSSTQPSTFPPSLTSDIIATPEHENGIALKETKALPPHTTLAQLSYAPATQTTVVTTTTTTTTSFPPLIMRAPRYLNELDPKQYPLASSPTPRGLKNVCFDYNGMSTCFRESDDASESMEKLSREHTSLAASNGILRTVARPPTTHIRTSQPRPAPVHLRTSKPTLETPTRPAPRTTKRSASPVSISKAAEIAKSQRSGRKPHQAATRECLETTATRGFNPGDAPTKCVEISTPNTPNTNKDTQLLAHRSQMAARRDQQLKAARRFGAHQLASYTPDREETDTPSTMSPQSVPGKNVSFMDDEIRRIHDHASSGGRPAGTSENDESPSTPGAVAAATPPIADSDLQRMEDVEEASASEPRPALPFLDLGGLGQDVSLPSPSLSPVTAALNHGHSSGYFGVSDEDVESQCELPPPQQTLAQTNPTPPQLSTPFAPEDRRAVRRQPAEADLPSRQLPSQPTLMDIPTMLNSFDAMPMEMQTYMMHQFLRRSAKPTLQFVAETVNTALKCDFLELLPLELSLNIIRSLDFKSLCRAAQVSRKWRGIIDSDERVWKEELEANGYEVEHSELQRAVKEGWGWQHPSGACDYEHDLTVAASTNHRSLSATGMEATEHAKPLSADQAGVIYQPTPHTGRPKRKAAPAKYASVRKVLRRKEPSSRGRDADGLLDQVASSARSSFISTDSSPSRLSISEGPYATADIALAAVPNPTVGLSSLKNLHLYKSIYRRHHAIRKCWMQEDVKPGHLAFRAHQRHVVTCLQFDTDKILTGSDDTNINVYDTKTGALRCQLEGHEGGVWALQYEGNVLVSGSTDRSVRVWDIEKGKCTQVFQGHTSTVRCLQILIPTEIGRDADDKPITMPKVPLIITGSRDSNLRIWKLPRPGDPAYLPEGQSLTDVDCPYFVRTLTGHHHSVRAIAAHGDTLVSGSYDCTVRVWRISTGETVHRLQGHTQKVYSVVLDHKRNRCISGSMDYLVKVWSLETGQALYNLEGHTSLVGLLDLSHDRLVSAAADSTLRTWDPENGQCKNILSEHTGAITCFQHDGQKVISGSDRTLKMWDVKTGKWMRDLLTDLSGVWQVKFNERRCVAAVQRNNLTYIEVIDFGAARDGVPEPSRGRRIVVDVHGHEVPDSVDLSNAAAAAGVDEMAIDERD